jgi:hypothetical protein
VFGDRALRLNVGLGIGGPLVAALATWGMISRTLRVSPSQLTPRMFAALAVKMVFFGAFVALAIRGLGVRPVPFVVSFTVSFIALHGVEAILLRRALARLTPGPDAPGA